MGSAGAAELFFMVAATDATGSETMLRRIREQCGRFDGVLRAGLTLSAFSRPAGAFERNADESADIVLGKASTAVHALIDEEISSRMAKSGQ
jgi:hypothetical protein